MSQIGSHIDLRIDPRLTLQMDPPDWSRDDPPRPSDPHIQALSHTAVLNKTLFQVLLTVATGKQVSSKDWIAPPSRSQE